MIKLADSKQDFNKTSAIRSPARSIVGSPEGAKNKFKYNYNVNIDNFDRQSSGRSTEELRKKINEQDHNLESGIQADTEETKGGHVNFDNLRGLG